MILKGFYFRGNEYRLPIMLFNMIVKRPNKVFTLLWQEGIAYRIIADRSQNPNIFSLPYYTLASTVLCFVIIKVVFLFLKIPLFDSVTAKFKVSSRKINSIPGRHWILNINELRSLYVTVYIFHHRWPWDSIAVVYITVS